MTSTDAFAPEPLAADGGARRLAPIAEELDQKIRAPVDDTGLIAEAGRRVHEAQEVHELLDPVQIAEGVLHRGQRHEHGVARRLVALGER